MNYLFWGITTILTGLAAYWGSYAKKKGENRAIHDELQNVVKQMSEITKATEDIKAKISDDYWVKQRRWELKRDALMKVAEKLNVWQDAYLTLETTFKFARSGMWSAALERRMRETEAKWNAVSLELEQLIVPASIACEEAVITKIQRYYIDLREAAVRLQQPIAHNQPTQAPVIAMSYLNVTNAVRKELGMKEWVTPQSTESSAAPSPGSPTLE